MDEKEVKNDINITWWIDNWESRYPHLTQFGKYAVGFLIFVIGLPFAVSYIEWQGFPISKYVHLWYLTIFVSISILIEYLTEEIGKTNNNLLEDLWYAILFATVLSPYFYGTNSEFFWFLFSKVANNIWQGVIILKVGYIWISIMIALLFIWQILKCLHQVGKKNVFNVFYEIWLLIKDIIVIILKGIKKTISYIFYPFTLFFNKERNKEENKSSFNENIGWISVDEEKKMEDMNKQNLINRMLEEENNTTTPNDTNNIFGYNPPINENQTISPNSEEINPLLSSNNNLPIDNPINNSINWENNFLNQPLEKENDPLQTYFCEQNTSTNDFSQWFWEQKAEEVNPMLDNNEDIFWSLFGEEVNVSENFNNWEDLLSTLDANTLNSEDFIDNPNIEEENNSNSNNIIEDNQDKVEIENKDIYNNFFMTDQNFFYFSNGFFTNNDSIEDFDKEKLLIFLTNK